MEEKTKQLLRFTTAGSVDDGKSTLIGRLLHDSKSIFQDQLEAIEKSSKNKGFDYVDLSLLTDGLKSEREQGITIDVAYRYFETPKRKFIIADTPGHIQYTRNMVTGASTANLAIILIDARNGLVEQTHRHSFIASLLGIPHIIVCINKMDLVDFDEEVYNKIVADYRSFSSKLNVKDIRFVPISALNGDNVVDKSQNMLWYKGSTLLYELESIHISSDYNYVDGRFPIQYVIRPQRRGFEDYRAYSGKILSGVFRVGDEVKILPSGFNSKIKKIALGENQISEAYSSMSISMELENDIDISRGDMIVKKDNIPISTQDLDVIIIWMNILPLQNNRKLIIKHTTTECFAKVTKLLYEININTLRKIEEINELSLNTIGRIKIRTAKPLFIDDYQRNRFTGSLIFIDPNTNETLAAGILRL
ncbi:GTP-binding protein [Flavobacteriaceae bacterium]|nr:GTP-binding protein [Flavobacteriaceae bacterium]